MVIGIVIVVIITIVFSGSASPTWPLASLAPPGAGSGQAAII